MIDVICALLRGTAVQTSDESELGDTVAHLLEGAGVRYVREARLSAKERIDFLVCKDPATDHGVGLELKVDGSLHSLLRQLDRYASHDAIESLVVVTTLRRHRRLPEALREKPIRCVHMGGL